MAEVIIRQQAESGPWTACLRNMQGAELPVPGVFERDESALEAAIDFFNEVTFGDPEIRYSPLSQHITRHGVTVEVSIYAASEGGWLMHMTDPANNMHAWPAPFPSDELALTTAIRALESDPEDFKS